MSEYLYNPENEEALLGAIMVEPEVLQEFNLEPEEFFVEKNRFVWLVIRELRQAGHSIDPVTRCSSLDRAGRLETVGGPARITALVNACPSSLHAASYAACIHDDYMRRAALQIANRIANNAHDRDKKLSDFIPEMIDQLSRLAMTTQGAVHWKQFLSLVYDEVEKASANPQDTYGIPTGIYKFDAITGGLIRGEEMKLSGEPGIGKSMLAMQMVVHAAARAHPGACYHLEMKGQAVARRVLSAISGVSVRAMRTGKLEDGWAKFSHAIDQAEALPIYMSDNSAWTTAGLRVDLERLIGLYGIEWVLIDYEALLQDDPDKEDNQRSKAISNRLHDIIKDLNLAGLVIGDMHKAGMQNANMGQSSLAGSGRVIYNADAIWILKAVKDNPALVRLVSEKLREGEASGSKVVELQRAEGIPAFRNPTRPGEKEAPEPWWTH